MPLLLGLIGLAGVAHVLELYRQEMTRTIGLLDAVSIGEFVPHMVVAPSQNR